MSKKRRAKKSPAADLPGGLTARQKIARMIRVDHAGEYGAQRIYAGQLAVLKDHRAIQKMARQEDAHLAAFEKLIVERGVRPTALHPLWHVLGFALGAATAAMGEKAAMACTVAVEETIVAHYEKQVRDLGVDEPALQKRLTQFRNEEDEHRETGLHHGAEDLAYYPLLRAAIRTGSRAAIWLSERL